MADFDLLIVGAGLAGLTAGLVGARFGLRTCIVEHMATGGQVLNVEKIENFPGFPDGIAGFDLGPLGMDQAAQAGAEFLMDAVSSLTIDGDRRIVQCASAAVESRALILANGSTLRTL